MGGFSRLAEWGWTVREVSCWWGGLFVYRCLWSTTLAWRSEDFQTGVTTTGRCWRAAWGVVSTRRGVLTSRPTCRCVAASATHRCACQTCSTTTPYRKPRNKPPGASIVDLSLNGYLLPQSRAALLILTWDILWCFCLYWVRYDQW